MNILHLEASNGWGGQEIRILREAEGMRERGHKVVLAVVKGGALVERARKEGFTVYELAFRKTRWPRTLFSLLRIMKEESIDLVNTHSSLDSWIGGIAARFAKKKVIRTRHLSTPVKPGLNAKVLYGHLADFVVTTCAAIVPHLATQSGKSLEKLRSIPTGVNPDALQVAPEEVAAFRLQLNCHPQDFLVGTACSMRSWKGIDDFIMAAHSLRDVPGIKWVIIGGGHDEKHKLLVKKLKLEHLVHFTGHLDKPFAAIQALNAFALLSTAHEGVSQALLQAAWLQRPLIATTIGGSQEVCLNEVTGFTVAPFAPDQVAKAVQTLKEDPTRAQEFGQNAKKLVEERFTLRHTLDQMEEVYSRTL